MHTNTNPHQSQFESFEYHRSLPLLAHMRAHIVKCYNKVVTKVANKIY